MTNIIKINQLVVKVNLIFFDSGFAAFNFD